MTTIIQGAIRKQQLVTILQSLTLARPDLAEAFSLVAIATGLAGEVGAPQIVILEVNRENTDERRNQRHIGR